MKPIKLDEILKREGLAESHLMPFFNNGTLPILIKTDDGEIYIEESEYLKWRNGK
ncbi:hypothetical protein Q5O14_07760 [Eubacteriaceae bacterium ES2]|nr:hypothetical protein Q5O14_07760 [Eubacteriaceae bacterium ES2]